MTTLFGPDYSAVYDLEYAEKDYDRECDCIETAFRRHSVRPIRTVLDVGCGTGSHAIALARRTYEVTGVDRSPAMLEQARAKVAGLGAVSPPEFALGDARTFALDRTFDAVLMMFAVLGYQLRNEDLGAALATVRRHLAPGGLFVFDIWYGPAVLRQRPSPRLRVLQGPAGQQLIKASDGELRTSSHSCLVSFHLWQLSDGRLVREAHEDHEMRYFFPLELELALGMNGLELLRLAAFPDLERAPDDTTWNVLGVARPR